jgi:apolipoprotein N-acyltransferase
MMSKHALEGPRARVWHMPRAAWLLVGILVTFFVGNRYNVAPLGWVATVPWLVYLRQRAGWLDRVLLLAALQVGYFLALFKLVTEPLTVSFAVMFSIPVALSIFALFEVFESMRRRLGDGWGILLFPALTVLNEWLGSYVSPMGSWGSLAYTQIDNLPFLQLASVFGLTGISALLAASSAVAAVLMANDQRRRFAPAVAAVTVLSLAAHGYGAVRIAGNIPGELATVAGVVSEALEFRTDDVAEQDALFVASLAAVERGAELVVWNEVATIVSGGAEAAFVERGQQFAREHGVDLVMAFGVPQDDSNLFANQYVWLTPQGALETYLKHHPVPGEPSIPGDSPLMVHARPYGLAAGAICYDYDFPALGRTHGRLGAGLVVVPSSDWKGIDPYHTWMASVRGIESGFSVVRPVRAATSGAFDAFGRPRATMDYYEGDRMFIARVPTLRIETIYSRIGDVVPLLALLCVALAGVRLFSQRSVAGAENSPTDGRAPR